MPHAVENLEAEFAAWLGLPGAVATGFGRSALALALRALECHQADVLVPEFICAQVPEAVRAAGGRCATFPVGHDLVIVPGEFAAAITSATRAAIVAHYFGRVQPHVAELAAICRARGVALIEDCALALGASRDEAQAGRFGNLAIFSFTKSDWCYGGGMLAAKSNALLERARQIRDTGFAAAPRLLRSYGLLRRMDFLANRPRWSGAAERAGRWCERLAGFREGNFYDAGRFDARMESFVAARAAKILRGLPRALDKQRSAQRALVTLLRDLPHVLMGTEHDPGDSGAFLVLRSPGGRAAWWVEEAARQRVTLRHVWPAYQALGAAPGSTALSWFAEHVVVLEIHPQLGASEVQHIAACVRLLAGREERSTKQS